MCAGHWRRVPDDLQKAVYAAYRLYNRVNPETGTDEAMIAVNALRAAQDAAIKAVTRGNAT